MYDIEDSEILEFIKKNNATTRETAEFFGISRQTVSNRVKKSKNKEIKELLDSHHYKHKFKKKK